MRGKRSAAAVSDPAENERRLADDFLPLTNPQERLALIVEACAGGGIPAGERQDRDLVPGCVSRVWLRGARAGLETEKDAGESGDRLHLSWDAESPLVRGLAGLICKVYDGAALREAAGHSSAILTTLGLARQLSPTRLRGLAAVEARIRQLAVDLLSGG